MIERRHPARECRGRQILGTPRLLTNPRPSETISNQKRMPDQLRLRAPVPAAARDHPARDFIPPGHRFEPPGSYSRRGLP